MRRFDGVIELHSLVAGVLENLGSSFLTQENNLEVSRSCHGSHGLESERKKCVQNAHSPKTTR